MAQGQKQYIRRLRGCFTSGWYIHTVVSLRIVMLPGRLAVAACSMHFRASCKNAFSGRLNGRPIITAFSPSAAVHTLGAHAVPSASATARASVAASCLPSDSAAECPADVCCGDGCLLTAFAPMAWRRAALAQRRLCRPRTAQGPWRWMLNISILSLALPRARHSRCWAKWQWWTSTVTRFTTATATQVGCLAS